MKYMMNKQEMIYLVNKLNSAKAQQMFRHRRRKTYSMLVCDKKVSTLERVTAEGALAWWGAAWPHEHAEALPGLTSTMRRCLASRVRLCLASRACWGAARPHQNDEAVPGLTSMMRRCPASPAWWGAVCPLDLTSHYEAFATSIRHRIMRRCLPVWSDLALWNPICSFDRTSHYEALFARLSWPCIMKPYLSIWADLALWGVVCPLERSSHYEALFASADLALWDAVCPLERASHYDALFAPSNEPRIMRLCLAPRTNLVLWSAVCPFQRTGNTDYWIKFRHKAERLREIFSWEITRSCFSNIFRVYKLVFSRINLYFVYFVPYYNIVLGSLSIVFKTQMFTQLFFQIFFMFRQQRVSQIYKKMH